MSAIKAKLRQMRSEGHLVGPINFLASVNYRIRSARDYLNKEKLTRDLSSRHFQGSVEKQVEFAMNAGNQFFQPMQNRWEIAELMRRVSQWQPKRVLEIGTARGGTLFLFCQNAAPDATLVSIDLPHGINGGGYPEWKSSIYQSFAQPGQTVTLLRGNSHDEAMKQELLQRMGSEPFDLIMIDADHRYEGVKRDFELYAPLVAPDGVIVLHDILPNDFDAEIQVDRFWSEVKAAYDTEEIVENPEQGCMGIGLVRNYHRTSTTARTPARSG
ncbi:MAG: class I SAM-dependent methyltransferase [Erythrobacter sp.]